MQGNGDLRARKLAGGTPVLSDWGASCEYAVMRDVLLGPPETFHWMEDNAAFSSVVRATQRDDGVFDQQLAMRQHREMVEAYESAGLTTRS
jgi:hypothetical protein